MTEPDIYRVQYADLNEGDLFLLQKALDTGYTGDTVEDTLVSISTDNLSYWRVGDNGCIVLQLQQHYTGRECVVWAMAGTGLVQRLPEIFAHAKRYARDWNCRWVSCSTLDARLAYVLGRKLGITPKQHTFLEDLHAH